MDIKQLFNFTGEKRSYNPSTDTTVYADSVGGSIFANKASAMNLATIFNATNLISNSIARLPIEVIIKGDNDCENVFKNHPLSLVLSDRNCGMISKFTLIKLLVQSVILRGNGFAYIRRAKDGAVTSLQYLEPNEVSINYNKQTNELYYLSNSIKGKIEPKNMVHLTMYSYDGINGVSLLTYASRSVELAQSAENNAASFYKDGSNLKGILTVQGNVNEEQRKQIREAWENTNAKLRVLQGNMKYDAISVSPEDSQLMQVRQFNVADIARFFGINPILLSDNTHASYSTFADVQREFLTNCLAPWISMIEEEFNRKLLTISEVNLSIKLNTTKYVSVDKVSCGGLATSLLQNGVICINEARQMMDFEVINDDAFSKHIIPYTDINQNTINSTEEEKITKRNKKK